MSLMGSDHPMYMTYEEILAQVKPLMQRLNYVTDKGHPEDMVANLVPMLEAWSDGFGTGYMRGVQAGRDLQKVIDDTKNDPITTFTDMWDKAREDDRADAERREQERGK